jgi:hypothetical protein
MFCMRCMFVYSSVSTTWNLRNALKLTALTSRVPALDPMVSQLRALVHHPLIQEYASVSVKTSIQRDMDIVGLIEQTA